MSIPTKHFLTVIHGDPKNLDKLVRANTPKEILIEGFGEDYLTGRRLMFGDKEVGGYGCHRDFPYSGAIALHPDFASVTGMDPDEQMDKYKKVFC